MANKDFKVKNGLDIQTPLPVSMGGTGQTSTTNTLNSLLPAQSGNASKVLQTDGTNTTWVTLPSGYTKGNTASRPGSPSLGDIYSNTETGYIEVYTAAGWSQLGVIPVTPSTPVATDVGTNISYGSGAIDVAFTPAVTGGLASTFTATSSPGSITGSNSTSPVRVSGLTLGTAYTFTVIATNGYGNAVATSPSNSVTTTSVPQAPTIGTASNTLSGGQVSLTFTAGATGGKSISNYKYSTDGVNYTAFSPAQTTSPLTISGLTNGTAYSFYLKAVNANGDSTASSASNSVTPTTFAATGGTIVTSGGYKYHTFTSNGTFQVTSASSAKNIELLCIAGGGGGGGASSASGGGGAGGVLYNSAISTSVGSYSVTVGGGAAVQAANTNGNNGSNSVYNGTYTAVGGGGGAGGSSNNGGGGGSGGGATGNYGYSTGGAATSGQGFRGGNTALYNGSGCGGGGAGAQGGDKTASTGGSGTSGGSGTATYSAWASATSTGSGGYYAGGGGGGCQTSQPNSGAGAGGGGYGSASNAASGSTNTGGGGGAGMSNSGGGGSGIVIIRYALA